MLFAARLLRRALQRGRWICEREGASSLLATTCLQRARWLRERESASLPLACFDVPARLIGSSTDRCFNPCTRDQANVIERSYRAPRLSK